MHIDRRGTWAGKFRRGFDLTVCSTSMMHNVDVRDTMKKCHLLAFESPAQKQAVMKGCGRSYEYIAGIRRGVKEMMSCAYCTLLDVEPSRLDPPPDPPVPEPLLVLNPRCVSPTDPMLDPSRDEPSRDPLFHLFALCASSWSSESLLCFNPALELGALTLLSTLELLLSNTGTSRGRLRNWSTLSLSFIGQLKRRMFSLRTASNSARRSRSEVVAPAWNGLITAK